jgi:hypothetical protein
MAADQESTMIKVNCLYLVKNRLSPSRGVPIGCRFSLAVSAVSSFVPLLGPPWHHRDSSSLTDPTVQISRSGFLKQDSPGTSRDVESEAIVKDTYEGVVCISPKSSGSLACVD